MSRKLKLNVPGMSQELYLDDTQINNIHLKDGNRLDIRFKNVPDYLTGLYLRYSPKTQSKVFYLKYFYEGKSQWLKLKPFLPNSYGSIQVSKEVIKLREKYYQNGKWKHNPKDELLTIAELEAKEDYKVRDIIKQIVKEEFPRITKVGKLDSGSQRTYSRVFLGTPRVEHLNYTNDDKEYGRITFSGLKDLDSLWSKYPQKRGDKSVFDSALGSAFIKDINRGVIETYVLKYSEVRGTRKNLLKALQYLWNYAETHLKAFGSRGLEINPTHKVSIPQTDEINYKGHIYNDFSFGVDQLKIVEDTLLKISKDYPFSSEALLMVSRSRFRLSEVLKLRKSDVKEDHILFRKEIQKDKAKGRQKDIKVLFTKEITEVLLSLAEQRKSNTYTQFSPWLFPNIKSDYNANEEPINPRIEPNSHTMRETWGAVKNEMNFEGSIKTLRKTFITKKVEYNKSKGMSEAEAINETAKETHADGSTMVKNVYYKPDLTAAKKVAKQLGQVLSIKTKN